MDTKNDNLVVVWCLAYNQAKYISQCLEGFVMQQTNFPFYAVVHDDASNDGTAEIIKSYAEKYPETIHPILETENQWSKNNGALGTIMAEAIHDAKYFAICEGDDYWIDPHKLQKQVDFLEAHDDFSICFHEAKVYKQNEERLVDSFIREVPSETDIYELAKGNYIHTVTVLYRNNPEVNEELKILRNVITLDYPLHMLNAKHGKIKKLPDCMAVYRLNQESVWGTKDDTYKLPLWNEMLIKIMPFFDEKVQQMLHEQYMGNCKDLYYLGEKKVRSTRAFRLGHLLLHPFKRLTSKE